MKIISILILSSLSFLGHARWPSFSYPALQLIESRGHFDSSGCPSGELRLLPKIINISESTCETFCPNEWEWTAKTDGNCHNLADLSFKNIQIIHLPGHDRVIASYESKKSNALAFSYEMQTLPGSFYYCTQYKHRLDYVVCANDTFRIKHLAH